MSQSVSHSQPKVEAKTGRWALFALAISAFGIGTTEFVPVGLITTIANDLNIAVTLAGLLISGYALGVAIGAPILTALTNRMSRKSLLMSLMIVFIIGNVVAAIAPNFELLLIARFITAFSHGVFFSIGATIAVQLVSPEKKASAIALMFTGLTIAIVTGVPLGTYIGQAFGWRATFWGVALLGVIAIVSSAILIPKNLKQSPPTKFTDMFRLLTNSRLLLGFLITALGYGGTFVAFTYLTPLLHDVTGISQGMINIILIVYGIAVAFGNSFGGKLANKNPIRALFWMFIIQAAVLVLLTFLAPFKAGGIIGVILMGLFAFMNVPGLQLYVVQLAEKYVHSAVDVASAINIAAFNVGIAIGSVVGGVVVDHMGYVHTPWLGAIMVFVAIILTGISAKLEKN
ncbi:MFS sugar transporter [Bacillus sp. FJAT-27264]|uniref:MFS transporter n=1 Tax=Paenibacillus sp. (strain DSM 101736 / FJAT-27264) TaxID=1850362 RepID=UPI000807A5AE|nr:MFS transporter [Bacillus sp. FJAT-27264]OBZ14910.1 MFS sugar transporter [Bacillus sp. FJAT-27264]